MEDLFKKFINAGVGLASLTTERVQGTIDKLVQESKLSEQEGSRIMDDLKKNTDTKRKELEKQVQGLASRLLKGAGLATNADVEELKRTVKGGSRTKAADAAEEGTTSRAAAKGSSTAAKDTSTKSSSTTGKSKKAVASDGPVGKAGKTAAKKANSPNDSTSDNGSELS